MLAREPCSILVYVGVDILRLMSPLAPYFSDQRPGLAGAEHQQFEWAAIQSNTSGSTSAKNLVCNRRTASGTSVSSTTNVRLISDAPCEIMRTLMSPTASN